MGILAECARSRLAGPCAGRRNAMRALVLNATLKPSPETSNTEALAQVVVDALAERGVASSHVRLVDHDIHQGW
jgi:hypothetical protein